MSMELIFVLYVAFFTVLLSTCSSSSSSALPVQVQPSHQQAYEVQQLSVPILPRKLMKNTEKMSVRSSPYEAAQDAIPMPNNQKKPVGDENNSGKEKKVMTWHEWSKGVDTSEFFTMDYSHVRRRQPIHNKSLPP